MLDASIRDFPAQFEFEPKIENRSNLGKVKAKKYLVCGMGGSALAAEILKCAEPGLNLAVSRNYGLPELADLKDRLVILSSYSGNTEETISAFHAARKKKLNLAVVSKGGALIELAKEHGAPYIQIPDTGIQPRMATGFTVRALLALMGDREGLKATRKLAADLHPIRLEKEGREVSVKLRGRVPVIYASAENEALARIWKIKFNENGKIPAFWNFFPELNHNEMTGFDVIPSTQPLASHFHFIFLEDKSDQARIRKRMSVLQSMLEQKSLGVTIVNLRGAGYEKIFSALLLGDWVSYFTALHYGAEPEKVPMVEELKKLI